MTDLSSAEVWKPVPCFPGYEASSHGRVRTLDRVVARQTKCGPVNIRRAGKLLKPTLVRKTRRAQPYLYVDVSINGKRRPYGVHVLVCMAFHGLKPDDKDLAAHWDGDQFNNTPSNIRWATRKENHDDMKRHGTWKKIRKRKHLRDEEKEEICRLISAGASRWNVSQKFDIDPNTVSTVVKAATACVASCCESSMWRT